LYVAAVLLNGHDRSRDDFLIQRRAHDRHHAVERRDDVRVGRVEPEGAAARDGARDVAEADEVAPPLRIVGQPVDALELRRRARVGPSERRDRGS
jgi:hypothetical protein